MIKKNSLIAGSLAAIALLLAFPALATPKEKAPDVRDALKQWVAAVESGSVDDITDLYDSHAVMISAFRQLPVTTHAELVRYYRKVEANPDAKIDIIEQHPRTFGNFAVNSGLYTFHYTEDGEPVTVPARFTFVYILEGGKWVIIDHHSSLVPGGKER
ncbi:MAG: DUF4440 domain-containing protein [Pseudomonadota bacterium]|nr:DUF4440 domain-containing protein [Pseudomonadota bacterium]MDE3038316.1 DUF4440 domain-containing protein [Pseudomonadota bacterium]